MPDEELYGEAPEAGAAYRAAYLSEIQDLIAARRAASRARRHAFFAADLSSVEAFRFSQEPLRARFRAMLGYPLVDAPELPAIPHAKQEFVARDSLGEIYRLRIEALPGYSLYGLLFVPPGQGPHRLVIAQHGGQGTPELTAGFFGSANYNDMTRRILRRRFAVFAPQLLLWQERFGPPTERHLLDRQLKQLGGSIAALELFGLQRALDYLLARPEIRATAPGVCGLSYGGFYALFAAANDTRLAATVSSCFVNDRLRYDWPDWVWRDAANQFLDAEVAGLVCPRPLYVEVGESDELFSIATAQPVLDEIRAIYCALHQGDNFVGHTFTGGHEFATGEASLDFLCTHLKP